MRMAESAETALLCAAASKQVMVMKWGNEHMMILRFGNAAQLPGTSGAGVVVTSGTPYCRRIASISM